MNKTYTTIASAMVMFAFVVTTVVAPVAPVVAEANFGFNTGLNLDTNLELNYPDATNENIVVTTTSGETVSTYDYEVVECELSASKYSVAYGEGLTLDWYAPNFKTVKIDGQSVSGDSGSKTIGGLFEDATFILEAYTESGQKCVQQVTVDCEPPETPIRCEDFGYDFQIGKFEWNGSKYVQESVKSGYSLSVTGNAHTANWTANPAVDGVIAKAATVVEEFAGGTSGSVSKTAIGTGKHDISNIAFCGYDKPEEPKECELEITKSVDKHTAQIGDTLTYTINIKNVGTADCTGGGVKIEDVLDANLILDDYTYTSNLSAGYGNQPVFSGADRTIRFNGNTLTPGESGSIALFANVKAPAQCGDFEVKNKAKATAKELNNFNTWVYSNEVTTSVDYDCDPEDTYAKVVAHKIVCTDEAELPNWGAGGPNITANTAADWVASHNSCEFASGWEFEWTEDQSTDPGDTLVGRAGTPWNVFGPTDGNGRTEVTINLDTLAASKLWFREVLQSGFIPFTHGLNNQTNVDDVSAEFYCHTDVLNYDNRDFVSSLEKDKTYYCVAFNSPELETPAPSCDFFTANPSTIVVGASSTLSWGSTNATQAFINNGIGAVEVDGSIEVSPLADITYTLTLIGAEDKTVECEVPVTVSEDPVPVCEYFTATPNALGAGGGNVTLAWSVDKAVSASITPTVGSVSLLGTTTVNVTDDTNFILTAIDGNGDEVTCPAPVTVEEEEEKPFTCANNVTFTASDYSIRQGNEITLNWNATDVDSVTISPINATGLSGSRTVSPNDDTTYVLTATKDNESIECPIEVEITTGGGGGGSVSPRCELEISDKKITLGEEITLTWDTSYATEVTLVDDRGTVLFTTDDYLASDKDEYYDGEITVKPTRDTEYTLIAERGSRDRECSVEVEIENEVTVIQTRDQQPLVAGISLSQVPYTGFEAGPFMTFMFYLLLGAWAFFLSYLLVVRNRTAAPASEAVVTEQRTENEIAMKRAEAVRPDLFTPTNIAAAAATAAAPVNLPTGAPVTDSGLPVINPHQVGDALVTALEDRAHAQKALLSSDAVRHFISTTEGSVERNEALDAVIAEAKKNYPLEDGWIVVNEARMKSLCEECQLNAHARTDIAFVPSTIPEGSGSLAEAIVTGNITAAYEMIGNRPMFALADAAADLDALYRHRRGGNEIISDLLAAESARLSEAQIQEMIQALTSALDGTYTDEASAVKMAILKATKVAA